MISIDELFTVIGRLYVENWLLKKQAQPQAEPNGEEPMPIEQT